MKCLFFIERYNLANVFPFRFTKSLL